MVLLTSRIVFNMPVTLQRLNLKPTDVSGKTSMEFNGVWIRPCVLCCGEHYKSLWSLLTHDCKGTDKGLTSERHSSMCFSALLNRDWLVKRVQWIQWNDVSSLSSHSANSSATADPCKAVKITFHENPFFSCIFLKPWKAYLGETPQCINRLMDGKPSQVVSQGFWVICVPCDHALHFSVTEW